MAIDPRFPSTIYVASPGEGGFGDPNKGCGVWRSFDGGASWVDVTGDLPTLRIAAIAADPSDALKVYVATPGFGVFWSYAGDSWTKVSDDPGVPDYSAVLLVDPNDSQVLYLTANLGVLRSGDGGRTWHLSKSGGSATGLVMDPRNTKTRNTKTLYAGISQKGVFKTTTGGINGDADWTPLAGGITFTDMSEIRLAICDNSHNTVYALFHRLISGQDFSYELYRTEDAGQTDWRFRHRQVSSNQDADYIAVIGVAPDRPDIVYFGGTQFRLSSDGGRNLLPPSAAPHGDHHVFANHPTAPGVTYTGCDGGIYRSSDYGQHWEFIGEGITNVEFYDIAHAATEPDIVIGGVQDNGSIRFDLRSLDRSQIVPPLFEWRGISGGDGATVDIDPTQEDVLYVIGDQFLYNLKKSADGGWSFDPFANNLPTSQDQWYDYHFQTHPHDPSILLASSGSLWRTTTTVPPGNWSRIFDPPSGRIVLSAIDPTNGTYYAGSTDGKVYSAKPTNPRFAEVFTHPSGQRTKAIQVDPTDPQTVYLGFDTLDANRIFRLIMPPGYHPPGTVTLPPMATDITSNLPKGLTVTAIAVDHFVQALGFTIYVGTNRGVYRGQSLDGDTWNWSSYNKGLPLVYVTALKVHPITGIMRAATFGRGAFEVTTKPPLPSPPPKPPVPPLPSPPPLPDAVSQG